MCLSIFSVFGSPSHLHPPDRSEQISLSTRVYRAFFRVLESLKAFFQRLFFHPETQIVAADPIEVRMRTLEDRLWALLKISLVARPDAERDRFLEENLTLDALTRICTESPRIFAKRVERDQFAESFATLAPDGSEQRIFDQVDSELGGYVSVSIGEERYHSSRRILAELESRGMERARGLGVLSCLTHRGCHEATQLVTKLFTKIVGPEWNKRKVRLEPSEKPIRIEVKFAGQTFQGAEVRVNYQVVGLFQSRLLFTVSTRTWIEGATGHAEIKGRTLP